MIGNIDIIPWENHLVQLFKNQYTRLLIPTLKDFFAMHPLINPKTFLGDAIFDSCQLYSELLTGSTFGENKLFAKAYIPLNSRSGFVS